MAYSTLATQADTPTAGPDHTYFEQIAANETALLAGFGARISENAAQVFTGSTAYAVALGDVDYDSSPSMTGTANRLTVPTGWGGLWLITVNMSGSAPAAGSTAIRTFVRLNGSTAIWESYDTWAVSSGTVYNSLRAPFPYQLSAGDYIELRVETSFAALTYTAREDLGIFLAMEWLHP